MTTRSHKRIAVEELVSTEIETPLPEASQNSNPVAGTSKSPRVLTENLEEIKSSLRKEIMSDLTKILAENQEEMLKPIAPTVKKQIIITAAEETDSESENIPTKSAHKACHPTNDHRHQDYYSPLSRKSIHHLNPLQCQKPSPHLYLCLMVSPKNSNFSRTYFKTT